MAYQIYLARKLHAPIDEAERHWRTEINKFISELQRMDLILVDPCAVSLPESKYDERFKWCMESVIRSSLVVVDAVMPLGLGAGAEVMLAYQREIPIFIVCPNGSHYRRHKDWTHPFVSGLSTEIFDDYGACLSAVREFFSRDKFHRRKETKLN